MCTPIHKIVVKRTHWNPVNVTECILNLFELDKSSMFQIVSKAQSFDIFLKPRRDLALMSPEKFSFKFSFQSGVDCLNFTKLFLAMGSRA
jgi:hypothetical protein